jgi:hypothetical protein
MAQYRRVRRAVIVFAPRPATMRWINEELVGEPYKVIAVPSMAALVSRLVERADQIAIVDFDAVTDQDVAELAAIRDTTWTGELIALGRVEFDIRMLLRVREMFMRPLGSERLRRSLANITAGPVPISPAESTAEIWPQR